MTVSYDSLRSALTDAMPSPLYTLEAQEIAASVVADVTVRSNGDLTVTPRGESLRMLVPVRVKVDAYRQKSNGTRGVELGRGSAELTLRLDMTFRIDEDWVLHADISPDYRWNRSPTMTVGPITMSVQGLVEDELDAQLPMLKETLEQMVRETKILRPLVRKAWRSFLQPRRISTDPTVTIQFEANALTATDPQTSPRGLHMVLGATGPLQVWLGDAPQEGSSRERLPDRQPPSNETTATRLLLPVHLNWDDLTGEARAQLTGQSFSSDLPQNAGTATATVTDVLGIYPSGDHIAVGVLLQLAASGQTIDATVWLLAKPTVQSIQQALSLQDFSFAAQTNNAVANVALVALTDTITEALQSQLVFPLAPTIEDLLQEANAGFQEQATATEGLELQASLDDVVLSGVYVTEDHLVIHGRVSGELEAFLSSP